MTDPRDTVLKSKPRFCTKEPLSNEWKSSNEGHSLIVEKALYQLALLLCYTHSRVGVEGTLFKQRTNITMPGQNQKHGCESAVSRLESSRRISVWAV